MRKQSGSMLIDLILGAAIAMMIVGIFVKVAVQVELGRRVHAQGALLAAGAAALQSYLSGRGETIISSGTATGFANPYNPTFNELRTAGFMPLHVRAITPFGGTMIFLVRRGVNNDLLGVACDNKNVTQFGQPSVTLAAQVVAAAGGTGLRTSAAQPAVLNGTGFQNVASPVSGSAIVCAWSFIPKPN